MAIRWIWVFIFQIVLLTLPIRSKENRKSMEENLRVMRQIMEELVQNDIMIVRRQDQHLARVLSTLEMCQQKQPAPRIEGCPYPFQRSGTKCLFLGQSELNWIESERHCKAFGGDLVVIENEQSYKNVVSYLEKNVKDKEGVSVWVGGKKRENDEWYWVNGQPIKMGPPFWNNRDYAGGQNFAQLRFEEKWGIDAENQNQLNPFICEILQCQ